MEKERKNKKTDPIRQIVHTFSSTQSVYKRIAILIKARIILPCEVIATISLNAFSASIINASFLAKTKRMDDLNLRKSVSGEKPRQK